MEENKDDYLKKKLHIKDRFIKRLETEKRQLELDNNTLKHRLGLVQCRLDSMTRNRRKTTCEGLDTNHHQAPTQVEHPVMAASILPRYIPFPNSRTSGVLEASCDLHERIPMPAVNVGQDVKKDQLLNENLEYTLEISYLKTRLKSSDAARTSAERKIESLEEKLKHLEKAFDQEKSSNMKDTGQDGCHFFKNNSDRPNSQPKSSNAPDLSHQDMNPSNAGTPSNSGKKDGLVVYSTLMSCLNRILQAVVSLDEKMNHIQKGWQRHPLQISS